MFENWITKPNYKEYNPFDNARPNLFSVSKLKVNNFDALTNKIDTSYEV